MKKIRKMIIEHFYRTGSSLLRALFPIRAVFCPCCLQYFMYKLRNTSVEGDSSWTNETFFTPAQVMFLNNLELAALVPSVLFMFFNMAATR